jgi:hypothetical protein
MTITYQIRVKGHLDPIYEEWLGGFSITLQPDGETVLIGQVADQTALYGTLARIRDLGIPLLSVSEINSPSAEAEGR